MLQWHNFIGYYSLLGMFNFAFRSESLRTQSSSSMLFKNG